MKYLSILSLLFWSCTVPGFFVSSSTNTRFTTTYVRPHTANTTTPEIGDTSVDETFYILSTAKDTSQIFVAQSKNLTLGITATDTSSGGDSVDVDFAIFGAERESGFPSTFTDFVSLTTVTVASESKTFWSVSNDTLPRPLVYYYYITATGSADNKKLTPVSVTITETHTN